MQYRDVTDRQTDERTDRISISIWRVSIAVLTLDKNETDGQKDGCNAQCGLLGEI